MRLVANFTDPNSPCDRCQNVHKYVVLQTKALILTFQSAVIALPNTPPTFGRDELNVWECMQGMCS